MESSTTKYKVGDFVRCHYDFFEFYSYFYEEEYTYLPYYGIVVNIATDVDWITMEVVYKVYCLDGQYRFFLEDEIEMA